MTHKILLYCVVAMMSFYSCNSQVSGITLISPAQAEKDLKADASIQLVDVRTADEYNEGHLSKSTNYCVTTDEFVQKMATLDKEKPVYVYCRSGKRSAMASKILRDNGFEKIFEIEGGILSWQEGGLPVE